MYFRIMTQSERAREFPALAIAADNSVWLASIERELPNSCIAVDAGCGDNRETVCRLRVDEMTGCAAPAIAPWKNGCIIAAPMEWNDRWDIAIAFITTPDCTRPDLRFISTQERVNVFPALTIDGDDVVMAWESTIDGKRAIFSCRFDETSIGPVTQLSSPGENSCHPAIVTAETNRIFVAWESLRKYSSDIYGCWCVNGTWEDEERMTCDPRIERHPSLTSHNGDLWMAWEAQSFTDNQINRVNEHRVVVAQVTDNGLMTTPAHFERLSMPGRMLFRPQIRFDSKDQLWLTARWGKLLSHPRTNEPDLYMGRGEWFPVVWQYKGGMWTDMELLSETPGRWHPVPFEFGDDNTGHAAIQFDNHPNTWGARAEWTTDVTIQSLPNAHPVEEFFLTEPLEMPPTGFDLKAYMEFVSADFKASSWDHNGTTRHAYFGDFHAHSDLSVCCRLFNALGIDNFSNIRDIAKLDFCALTDHGYNHTDLTWTYNGEQTRFHHDDENFVTFIGEEWTSDIYPDPRLPKEEKRYGHHNLVFLDPYYKTFYDSREREMSPTEFRELVTETDYICIPHQLADGGSNIPKDWNFTDERGQCVAEIYQNRGSFEYEGSPRMANEGTIAGRFLQDAWAQGVVIGVIASPDHWGTNGKAGIWAKELTRECLFEALHARHTFGTTDAKLAVRLSTPEAIMGDVVAKPNSAISLTVAGEADRTIKEMVLFRNNKKVCTFTPNDTVFEHEWIDEEPLEASRLWYYARIETNDGELAWTSPIWFT